jgi:hypothetical protein
MRRKRSWARHLFLLPAFPLLAGCGSQFAPRQVTLNRAEVTVPLRYTDDNFLLQATINGHGPYTLLLDTGSSATTLSGELVRELRLPTQPANDSSTTPFGTVTSIQRVDIPHIRLNGAEFHSFSALVPPTEELFKGRLYRGILGFTTFSSLVWTFDGPGRRLILRQSRASLPPVEEALPLDAVREWPQWPVRFSHGRAIVPMSIDGLPGDGDLDVVLDTGCVWDFLLPASLQVRLPKLHQTMPGELLSASGLHPLNASILAGSLTIGKHNFAWPLVAYVPSPNGLAAVGAPVLKDFVITFDMPEGRVWMQRPSTQTASR